jgi:beta-lactam-binding protein with PASTA domain
VLRPDDTAMLDLDDVAPERLTREGRRARLRRRLAFVLLGLAAAAAAVAGVWYLGTLLTQEEAPKVQVPNVVGRPQDEAQATLRSFGLESQVTASVHDDTVRAGSVVRQVPGGRQLVDADTEIQLTLSLGPQQVAVPDVAGLSLDEARAAIREAGLVVGQVLEEPSDEVPEGEVIRTDPAVGEELPEGRRVDIVVSSGREVVRVRPVAGLSAGEAEFRLRDQGFEVLVVNEFSDTVGEGLVIGQQPAPSTELPVGEEVTIIVSRGPQEEPSPTPEPTETATTEPPTEPTPAPTP